MKYDFGHLALFTFANRALEWFFHFLLTLFAASLTCSSVTVTGTGFLRYFLLVNRLLYSFLSTFLSGTIFKVAIELLLNVNRILLLDIFANRSSRFLNSVVVI